MGVKIEAEGCDYNDALRQLVPPTRFNISISWRDEYRDMGKKPLPGCVVTVVSERVPREFDNAAEAARYILRFLSLRDAIAANECSKQKKKRRGKHGQT